MKALLRLVLACTLLFAITACDSSLRNREYVEAEVNKTRQDTPKPVDAATTLIKVDIEGDNVVYRYLVDEEQISIEDVAAKEDIIRNELKNSIELNEEYHQFAEACVGARMSIVLIYTGNTSHESFTLTFTPENLAG